MVLRKDLISFSKRYMNTDVRAMGWQSFRLNHDFGSVPREEVEEGSREEKHPSDLSKN